MIYYYHHNFLVCNLAEWIIKKKTTRNYQRICAAWRWERFKTWRTKHGGTFVRLYHSLLFVCFSACLSLYYHHYPLVSLSCLPVSFRFCLLYSSPPHWIPLNMMNRPLDGASEADSPCDWISSHWFKKKNNPARILLLFLLLFQEIRPY